MKGKRTCMTLMGLVAGMVGSYVAYRAYDKARKSCPPFRKRVYTDAQQLTGAFRELWQHPEDLVALRHSRRVASLLAEKIMLAVASVNGSRHPGLAHVRYAVRRGVPRDVAESLLRGGMERATAEEAPALLFAMHHAKQRGRPDAGAVERLAKAYGPEGARDVLTYVRLVTLASLVGNTLDALVSRALGHPSPDTRLRGELAVLGVFLFGVAPVLLPVILWGEPASSRGG